LIKHSIKDVTVLEGQLLDVANQIDALDLVGNDLAIAMRDILDGLQPEEIKAAFENYYGEYASSAPAHNAINLGLQSAAEQLILRADSTRARRGATTASVSRNKPAGAAGPHLAGQEMQGWITTYRTSGDRSASDGFNGYDASIGGFLIGMDLAVAENVLFGLAGGSGKSSIDQDNGAKTDTRTAYGSVYFSTGTESWFTDASFIYGGSSIDTELGSTFDTQAEFDAASYAFYFGAGKEISGDYLIVTPQASLLLNYYTQDSYSEEASNAVGREVDEFDALYIRSSLGLSAGMYLSMGSLLVKPEIRVAWEHEFNADEEQLSYSLIGGTGSYNLALQAPEEDIFKIGIGASTTLGDYLQLRVDLDARQAGDYSDTTVVGSLRYQF
ncbi:MAG TPA: autotransporter outer membrane beta-barrel domain-containing protein, partial [Pontiella sp.]